MLLLGHLSEGLSVLADYYYWGDLSRTIHYLKTIKFF